MPLSLEKFSDAFFRDDFSTATALAEQLEKEASSDEEYDYAINCAAKVLLKQGKVKAAQNKILESNDNHGLKLFLEFLTTGKAKPLINYKTDDIDTLIYKAQTILLSKIYWGIEHVESIDGYQDPDLVLEEVFARLVKRGEVDKAILASVQSMELTLEDQVLSHDIHLPIIHEQIINLLELSSQAKYDSTRAKLYLLKARIFKDREAAGDAEILFGRDNNINGLGETYMQYAKDFNEEQYYEKAIENFKLAGNEIAQGFIFEALASNSLISGQINEAEKCFEHAESKLNNGGIFEFYGLEVQRISMLAIKGKYQSVKERVHSLINPNVPSFFVAQAYQILANTMIQLGEDIDTAKAYIETACDIFKQLKRYNQLLYTQNVYFQILLLEDDLERIEKLGREIIQLSTRLGNEELKASKYLDLAFVTIRLSLEDSSLNEAKITEATDYFNKAIQLYQDQDNLMGEADTYQAMGNMFTGIGKLEEALNAFLQAKKLYNECEAKLQAAITDTLIGILMLNYVVLNAQTYPIAMRHLETALVYFNSENLYDLIWKTLFYLADLNHRYFIESSGKEHEETIKNKAKTYYLEMLVAVQDYEQDAPQLLASSQNSLVGITIKDAYNKAYQFFLTIGEEDIARKFKQSQN